MSTEMLEGIERALRGTLPVRLGYRGVVGGPELALTIGDDDRVVIALAPDSEAPITVLAASPSIARRVRGELARLPGTEDVVAALDRVIRRWPELLAAYPPSIRCPRRLLGDRGGAPAFGAVSARAGRPTGMWSAARGALVLPATVVAAAAIAAEHEPARDDDGWSVVDLAADLADVAEVASGACDLASWLGSCDPGCDLGCA